MSLSGVQREFTKCVGKLIDFAYENGYELTVGDAYRDPRVHGEFKEKKSYSAASSVHKLRLAIDLNLWIDGNYVTDSESYSELGEYWKTLHDRARWGGDFKSNPDGNHFSFTYWGVM